MQQKMLFIAAIIALPLAADAVKESWTIIGGNRGVGYALAQELCSRTDCTCTLLVREKAKTAKLYHNVATPPTIIEGDAATDESIVKKAASDADYLVIAQTFPYNVWEQSLKSMMQNAITAAQETGATLIYYGRIYRYGLTPVITEDSTPYPKSTSSHQARVMDEVEMMLENAQDDVSWHIVRHATPFGAHIGDGLLEENFTNIPKNTTLSWYQSLNPFKWIGASEKAAESLAIQMAYTPDLARFTYEYVHCDATAQSNRSTINFAGLNTTIKIFAQTYCDIAHSDYSLSIYTQTALKLASAFNKEAARAIDAFYSFENEILLDATKQKKVCPFALTPLKTALEETYQSYAS